MQQKRENAIQWLRAIAAIEVVVWHSDLLTKHFAPHAIQSNPTYMPFGGIGVEIFFIVSGYLMCLIRPHYPSAASFIYGRIVRIIPMYWIFTSLVIVANAINENWKLGGSDYGFVTLIKSYLILPQERFPILGVGWSLEYEMIFYVFVAATMLRVFGSEGAPKMRVAFVLLVTGLIGLGFIADFGSQTVWHHVFSPYMLLFAYGWAARSVVESRSAWVRVTFLVVNAGVIVGGLTWLWGGESQEGRFVVRVLFAAAVFTMVNLARDWLQMDNPVNRAGSALADASYSLYLSHWFVLSIMGKVFGVLKLPPMFDVPIRILGIAVAIGFALMVFRYVEQPIERRLRRKGLPRRHRAAHASPLPAAQ